MSDHVYNDTDESVISSWWRVHTNYEETHVYLIKNGSKKYTAVAVDFYPDDFEAIAAEIICHEKREEVAEDRAVRWMEDNPKGIAGDGSGSGSGILSTLMSALQSVDEQGKQLADQQQDRTEEEA